LDDAIMKMRAWKRIVISVVAGVSVLAAGVWLLVWSLTDREMQYGGKFVRVWIEESHGQDAVVSNRAVVTLSAHIIPQLTNQMFQDTNDSRLQMVLIERLNDFLPGVELQYAPAPFRRAAAARQLGEIGTPAQVAIPALLQVLKADDTPVRANAAGALGQIHREPALVIPALLTALNDPQSSVRTAAAEALASWGQDARAAVPRLVQLLDDQSDRDLFEAVREALKEIDPEAAAKAGLNQAQKQ
jgi:HEAT repeat protein